MHGNLDRRGFLNQAQKYAEAGGGMVHWLATQLPQAKLARDRTVALFRQQLAA